MQHTCLGGSLLAAADRSQVGHDPPRQKIRAFETEQPPDGFRIEHDRLSTIPLSLENNSKSLFVDTTRPGIGAKSLSAVYTKFAFILLEAFSSSRTHAIESSPVAVAWVTYLCSLSSMSRLFGGGRRNRSVMKSWTCDTPIEPSNIAVNQFMYH